MIAPLLHTNEMLARIRMEEDAASVYVPAATWTVPPVEAALIPAGIVSFGADQLSPLLLSLPVGETNVSVGALVMPNSVASGIACDGPDWPGVPRRPMTLWAGTVG